MPAALISDHHPEVPGHRSRACPRSALNALVSKSPKSTDSHPLRMAVSILSGRWYWIAVDDEIVHHHQSDADAYRDDAMASSAFLLPDRCIMFGPSSALGRCQHCVPRPLRRRLHSEWPGRESGQNRTPIFMTRTPVCSRVALRLERRDEQA